MAILLGLCRSRFRRRFMRRSMWRAAARVQNRNFIDLRRVIWPIVPIARHASDFLDQFDAGSIALSKNRVMPVQAWIRNFRDEELRPVGVGAGIGVSKPSWTIKCQVRGGLVLEFVSGVALSVTHRI